MLLLLTKQNTAILLVLLMFFSCSQKGLLEDDISHGDITINTVNLNEIVDKNPTFLFYGDSRTGWRLVERFLHRDNWLTWKHLLFPFYDLYLLGNGILGGAEYLSQSSNYGEKQRTLVSKAALREIEKSGADFILAGEFVTDGRRPSHWKQFIKEYPFPDNIPLAPVVSNHDNVHDKTFGSPNYKTVFDYPGFYTLDFPDAILIVIDSNIIIDQGGFIDDVIQDDMFQKWIAANEQSREPAWLERVLAATDKKFKIVAMHHTPVSFGFHRGDWEKPEWGYNLPSKRSQLLNLLQRFGVKLVLSGHEHFYEKNILRYRDTAGSDQTMHIIVSGGGGVPLRDIADNESLARYLDYYR